MDSLNIPVKTESYGFGGLTSKKIYNALFELERFKMFMKNGYHYCIVSAGINDTYKKMSKSYYKTSMNCIIRFLIDNRIFPIILEIPDYNIYQAYNNQKKYKKIIQRFSMFVNSTEMDCKQQFRNALNEEIKEKRYGNMLSIIPFKSWNKDYNKDLETIYNIDQVHLNERGYATVFSGGLGTRGSDGFTLSGSREEVLAFKSVIDWLNGRATASSRSRVA